MIGQTASHCRFLEQLSGDGTGLVRKATIPSQACSPPKFLLSELTIYEDAKRALAIVPSDFGSELTKHEESGLWYNGSNASQKIAVWKSLVKGTTCFEFDSGGSCGNGDHRMGDKKRAFDST